MNLKKKKPNTLATNNWKNVLWFIETKTYNEIL